MALFRTYPDPKALWYEASSVQNLDQTRTKDQQGRGNDNIMSGDRALCHLDLPVREQSTSVVSLNLTLRCAPFCDMLSRTARARRFSTCVGALLSTVISLSYIIISTVCVPRRTLIDMHAHCSESTSCALAP